MLNTVLTVRKGDANSHQKKGYVYLYNPHYSSCLLYISRYTIIYQYIVTLIRSFFIISYLQLGRIYRCSGASAGDQEGNRLSALGKPGPAQVSTILRDCCYVYISILVFFVYHSSSYSSTLLNYITLNYTILHYTRCKGINAQCNTMITTSHPSPLGAYKTASPFMGSR